MIIPIRCFTCNAPIASKYKTWQEIVTKIENNEIEFNLKDDDGKEIEMTAAEKAFNILEVDRYCCRRHLISHTDLVDII